MKVETLQMSKTMSKPIKAMSQKFPKPLGNRQTKENTACVFKNCNTAVLWSGVKVSRKTLLGEVWRAWRAALHVVTGLMWLEKWSLSFVYLTDHSSGIFCWCVKEVLVGADLCWSSACESAGQFQWLFHRVLQHLLLRVYWFYSTSHPLRVTQTSWSKDEFARGSRVQTHPGGSRKGMNSKSTGICWRLVQHGFAPWAAPISTF